MKVNNTNDLILAVVIATILFFLMVGFIVSYFVIYRRKKEQYAYEMKIAKEEYEKQLLQSQLEIQEQTFDHISQEIHDNVGQILSLARIQINIMNESDTYNREMLNEVKQHIGKAMTDLRDIAKGLSSDRIRNTSIVESIRAEVDKLNKAGILRCTLSTEGAERGCGQQKQLLLFRIIQECMQNIIKHADASEMSIFIGYPAAGLEVTIRDNGKGFDPEKAIHAPSGLGLANIRKRAALTGGSATIRSELNQGTTINIIIPYE